MDIINSMSGVIDLAVKNFVGKEQPPDLVTQFPPEEKHSVAETPVAPTPEAEPKKSKKPADPDFDKSKYA